MIGWTLCSGIGAPEVAAPWVDWRLASEIEQFPRAVLQERFGYRKPSDHNQGDPLLWSDMTEVTPELARSRGIPMPDILVAGTPCQAFSIAGLREGVKDPRGNLTLKFVETCHDLAAARPDGKLAVLWENVPGVLSDKGNAFGCFLAGLVGADDAFEPPEGASWPGIGMVSGPRARAAWRVLDAQYFGVAQRRRRVFVVIDFGGAVDPAAVLFERKSLRGDTPPRREAREGYAGNPAHGFGGGRRSGPVEVAASLAAHGVRMDFEVETFVAHSLQPEGYDASEDGTGRGTPIVPVAFSSKDHGADAETDLSPTLRAGGHAGSHANAGVPPAIAIQERAVSTNPASGPQGAVSRADDTAFTLEARNKVQAVAFAQNTRDEVRLLNGDGQISAARSAETGAKQQTYLAFDLRGRDDGAQVESVGQTVSLRAADGGSSRSYVADAWAVRRLMPVECARLQGFPDDHTAITYRGKPAADGPQYKALGNSMAVPCIKWIMDRMRASMEAGA